MAHPASRATFAIGRLERFRPRWDVERLSFGAALVFGIVFGLGQATGHLPFPIDFVIYWKNTDLGALYPVHVSDGPTPYLYPPVLAQFFLPFHVLPFAAVEVAWTILCFLSLWYCARAWTIPIVIAGFASIWIQPSDGILGSGLEWVLLGNVQIPMAAAIVAGMRHPGWFAVPILTKVTAGVGLLWYAFRGEWRRFAIGLAVVGAIAAASFLLAPGTWIDWLGFLGRNYGEPSIPPDVAPPLWLRLPAAVLLVAWGARTNRPWTVAVGGALSLPVMYSIRSFVSVALGAWALRRKAAPAGQATRVVRVGRDGDLLGGRAGE